MGACPKTTQLHILVHMTKGTIIWFSRVHIFYIFWVSENMSKSTLIIDYLHFFVG